MFCKVRHYFLYKQTNFNNFFKNKIKVKYQYFSYLCKINCF